MALAVRGQPHGHLIVHLVTSSWAPGIPTKAVRHEQQALVPPGPSPWLFEKIYFYFLFPEIIKMNCGVEFLKVIKNLSIDNFLPT